jgi:glycerate-2-kinase
VIGDDIGAIASGPTHPDASTFADAMRIVEKYDIGSPAVRHIGSGAHGRIEETPKKDDPVFGHVHNFLIGNNAFACEAAVGSLRRSGLKAKYVGSEHGGAAEDFGKLFAKTAANLKAYHAVVAGGETTVRLGKNPGMGGRNQQAALAYALSKPGNAVAAFMGTDGIDGNSDAAGALISQKSIAIAEKIEAERYLALHDSYHALEKMNALLFTGLTGTNVNDIAIASRLS